MKVQKVDVTPHYNTCCDWHARDALVSKTVNESIQIRLRRQRDGLQGDSHGRTSFGLTELLRVRLRAAWKRFRHDDSAFARLPAPTDDEPERRSSNLRHLAATPTTVHCGIGMNLAHAYVRAGEYRDRLMTLAIRRSFAQFGSHSTIRFPVRLWGTTHIAVGSENFIGPASWLQVIDDPAVTDQKNRGIVIDIGDRVRMSGMAVISAARSVVIEDGALLARNVFIADHGHAFDDSDRLIHEQGPDSIRPVRIGQGAWLGQNVVVLPGTSIGRGAIVGANSVVGGSVPDRCVAVGAPARVVRTLDD